MSQSPENKTHPTPSPNTHSFPHEDHHGCQNPSRFLLLLLQEVLPLEEEGPRGPRRRRGDPDNVRVLLTLRRLRRTSRGPQHRSAQKETGPRFRRQTPVRLRGFPAGPVREPLGPARDPGDRDPVWLPARSRPLRVPGGPEAEPRVPHRAGHAHERAGTRDGVGAGARGAGVREEGGKEGVREASGGTGVEDVLQREEVRVRAAARVRERGVEGAEGGGADLDGRRSAPCRRRVRSGVRGRAHVHESAFRARGGFEGLGGVLHDEPGRGRRAGAQHLLAQSLVGCLI